MPRAAHALDLADLLDAWPLPGPWTTRIMAAGSNNRTWYATGPAGAFVVRVSAAVPDRHRLAAEHRLLHRLAHAGLPYAVPAPVAARSGSTLVPVENDGGGFAALFPVIPGDEPDPRDLGHIAACGAALCELHAALAAVGPPAPPTAARAADLGGLTDRLAMEGSAWVEAIGLPADLTAETASAVDRIDRDFASFLTTLPTQVIHGDYDASNVLLADGRVSSVLDFEFAAVGLRALDIASGLWSFALDARDRHDPWVPARAFLGGYREAGGFTGAEAAALPDLVLARQARSLRHRAGQLRGGSTTVEGMEQRARTLLTLTGWVDANRDRVLAAAR